MLIISLEEEKYEYDIRAIIKAFYPEKTVTLITPSMNPAKKADFLANASQSMQGMISFLEDKIEVTLEEIVYCLEIERNFDSLQYKDEFKEFLYQILCKHTETELPWGNMTGIRPTKVATTMIQKSASDEEIYNYYKKKHFVSDEKIALSVDIAHREHKLLSTLHCKDGFSLYIGIPFCPTTCLYCSFTSYPIALHRKRVNRYIDCLIKEMDYIKTIYADKILDTVYIGGGTPTTLEPDQMNRLIVALKEHFDFSNVQEFTVEAGRADSITREKLEVLHKHKVDRISINPQTMHDKTLKVIGRNHTVADVIEAYQLAREIGFTNINMDLILGLPGELEEDVRQTIEQVVALNPDSLTVHSLAIKRASNLADWMKEHDIKTIHNTDETMKIAVKGAEMLEMKPYYLYRQKNMSGNFENVGYAKDGKFGIYNILIMEEIQTIVALGAGSITKRVYEDAKIKRCDNVKDVELYMERIDEMIERKRLLLEQ